MTAKVFVDSNILVYAHDADGGPKQKIVAAQVRALWEDQSGRISTQVLQEFYITVTQKVGNPLVKGNAREIVRDYA
jgi:predicted nucleic acid-binding protein